MRRNFLLLLLVAHLSSATGQYHYPDEWWPIGVTDGVPGALGYGQAWVHFHDGMRTVTTTDLQMNLESTVAVASDTSGKVVFYSNGCEVRNAQGNLLESGDDLNPGELHDWVCSTGYTVPRGMMALPWPGSSSRWLLLHTGGQYDPVYKLKYGPFYYTEVDMAASGGTGSVVSKNNVLANGDLEPFSVVRHGNGRDWWIIIPEYGTNSYQLRLFTPTGISEAIVQNIGAELGCRKIGSSVFSPDGTKYARTNSCGAVVLDFDRCTGRFSSPVYLERLPGVIGGGGLAFSNDNRWLYVTADLSIERADLQGNMTFDSLFKRPYYEGTSDYVYSTSLAYMQRAPDGTIYMNARHRERYWSTLTIDNDSFQFKPKGVLLPVSTLRTLPYFPNFRLFDFAGSPCDTLGINPPTASQEPAEKLASVWVFPNPSTDYLTVEVAGSLQHPFFRLFDPLGRLIYTAAMQPGSNHVEVATLLSGIYYWEITSQGERIKAGKIIKI